MLARGQVMRAQQEAGWEEVEVPVLPLQAD